MPSRHTRKAKSTVITYSEKKTQAAASKAKNTAQSTPTITVTSASPSEDILHSSWKVLYIYQFMALFRIHLNLPAISLHQLESILLFQNHETNNGSDTTTQQLDPNIDDLGNNSRAFSSSRESSVGDGSTEQQEKAVAKVIIPILISLYDDKRQSISGSNYPRYIYRYLYNHSVEEDIQEILERYPDTIPFTRLALLEKIDILKELVDSVFETGAALEWKNTLSPEDMRASPMGKDSEGWSYWVFEDSRLYREVPNLTKNKETDYTFELVADTQDEWEKWMNKFSPKSSKQVERALALNLQEHGTAYLQKMEAKKAAKLREEARLERAKQIDLLPRKRSRRIEVKSEADEKRRQLEELEQAQWEYEEAQREHERKAQEEEDERDRKTMQIEEARLKENVYQLMDSKINDILQTRRSQSETNDSNTDDKDDVEVGQITRLKFLRSKMKKSVNYAEVVDKVSGWAALLDDDYKMTTTPTKVLPKYSQDGSDVNQEDEQVDIESIVSYSDTISQPTESSPSLPSPKDRPSTTGPSTQSPSLDQPGMDAAKPDTIPSYHATRGRPRKFGPTVKQATNLPLCPFIEAVHFTGKGTKSDLTDPLQKLILCTLISYLRQHPDIADLDLRNTNKWKKKRKASAQSPSLDFYMIHKKLLLGRYKSDNAADQTDTENGTTDLEQNSAGGLSAFDYWLKDMNAVLSDDDLDGHVDTKLFIYNLFNEVFAKVD